MRIDVKHIYTKITKVNNNNLLDFVKYKCIACVAVLVYNYNLNLCQVIFSGTWKYDSLTLVWCFLITIIGKII